MAGATHRHAPEAHRNHRWYGSSDGIIVFINAFAISPLRGLSSGYDSEARMAGVQAGIQLFFKIFYG
jgi:hypothetical protein